MGKVIAAMFQQSLKDAHETLESTMKGVTEEVAHWYPQGKALPVGAAYTHALVSEDVMLNTWVRKATPLINAGWSKKMGLSIPHPPMDADWEKHFEEWTRAVRVDLPKLKEYAAAVYRESDEYLGSLTDSDLSEKKVDLSMWEMGSWPLGRFIMRFILSHVDSVTGEISAVKGLQGLKGYPF